MDRFAGKNALMASPWTSLGCFGRIVTSKYEKLCIASMITVLQGS
jgi:hypothetical protein